MVKGNSEMFLQILLAVVVVGSVFFLFWSSGTSQDLVGEAYVSPSVMKKTVVKTLATSCETPYFQQIHEQQYGNNDGQLSGNEVCAGYSKLMGKKSICILSKNVYTSGSTGDTGIFSECNQNLNLGSSGALGVSAWCCEY